MCFVFISEQTATCATYSINWLVFISQMKSVYSAVRTGSLNKAVCALSLKGKYRVSIKSFPDYKHLLQENYVEYKHIFLPLLKLVSKILRHVFIVTFGFSMQHFQTGGLGETVQHPGRHSRRISAPFISFYGGMLRTKCFRHQFQILQIWRQE